MGGIVAGVFAMQTYAVMPDNSISDCLEQFEGTNRTIAGSMFCECVHTECMSLDACLEKYEAAGNDIFPKTSG